MPLKSPFLRDIIFKNSPIFYSVILFTLDNEIMGYITKIYEYKDGQQLFINQKKEKLKKLVEIAKIQSMESSNKIEGIVFTGTRIRQLVQEKTTRPCKNFCVNG